MASGYFALMALCCCIKGVSEAVLAMVGKNIDFAPVYTLVYEQFIPK
jgi:hypothetical protein